MADSKSDCLPLAHISDLKAELPVTWSGKPMRLRSLRAAWKRVSWIKRLCGLTLSPSTLQAGAEKWIASLPVSHVNRTPSQDDAKEPTTRAGFGLTSPGSCAIAALGSSCWRMCQGSLLPEDSSKSSVTWPKWGSLRNGVVYLRPTWEPAMSANVGSVWPTPHGFQAGNGPDGNEFSTAIRKWTTPQAHDITQRGSGNRVNPKAGKSRMDMLDWQAESFSPQAKTTNDGSTSSPSDPISRRRLNAEFVCWLMGLPSTWLNIERTSYAPEEMELYHSKLQQRLCDFFGR
jgi:hypothetical protein